MALNGFALAASLNPLFSTPPDNIEACASAWADAMEQYARTVVPTSFTAAAAAAQLKGDLTTAFQDNTSTVLIAFLEIAFIKFAATVGLGMAGYSAVPPSGFVGFNDFYGTYADSHSKAVANFLEKIDTWMRTGTSTLIAPPFTVVPWN